ncbi:TetR/AcrR family transcriptional regulator [bacterium]|jgi:AcrR family transcriptional regulator|nr:TetR/AcrR family transcriptional regulator [bacterium]
MRKQNAKKRILDTASELFSERGFLAVGINEIIEKSETAKASFYQHYKSKDLLCAAWLATMHERSEKNHETILQSKDSAEKKLRDYFDYLKDWLMKNDFRGCPFTNTAAVLTSGNIEIRAEIEKHKIFIRDFFADLAREYAVGSQGKSLGNTWFVLYSGATTEAQNLRATWPVDSALEAALVLCSKNSEISK